MPGPSLGLRDKMEESHPDVYSSLRTGQQKAEVLPGGTGVAAVCHLGPEGSKRKATP